MRPGSEPPKSPTTREASPVTAEPSLEEGRHPGIGDRSSSWARCSRRVKSRGVIRPTTLSPSMTGSGLGHFRCLQKHGPIPSAAMSVTSGGPGRFG